MSNAGHHFNDRFNLFAYLFIMDCLSHQTASSMSVLHGIPNGDLAIYSWEATEVVSLSGLRGSLTPFLVALLGAVSESVLARQQDSSMPGWCRQCGFSRCPG